jgi:hypothetical protein
MRSRIDPLASGRALNRPRGVFVMKHGFLVTKDTRVASTGRFWETDKVQGFEGFRGSRGSRGSQVRKGSEVQGHKLGEPVNLLNILNP